MHWLEEWSEKTMIKLPQIILSKSKDSEEKQKRPASGDADLLNSFYRIETTLPPNTTTVKKYLTFIKTYEEVYKREKDKISSRQAKLSKGVSKLVDAKIAMRGRMMHNNRKMGCIYSAIWNDYNNIWRFLSLFIRCCIITAWQRITTSITSYRLFGFVSSGWPQLPPHPGECRCRAWWPGHRVSSGPDPVLRWDVSREVECSNSCQREFQN